MSRHLKNLYKKSKIVLKNENGQGLVEYALILVLIAIVVMAAITNIGRTANSTFSRINSGITSP